MFWRFFGALLRACCTSLSNLRTRARVCACHCTRSGANVGFWSAVVRVCLAMCSGAILRCPDCKITVLSFAARGSGCLSTALCSHAPTMVQPNALWQEPTLPLAECSCLADYTTHRALLASVAISGGFMPFARRVFARCGHSLTVCAPPWVRTACLVMVSHGTFAARSQVRCHFALLFCFCRS